MTSVVTGLCWNTHSLKYFPKIVNSLDKRYPAQLVLYRYGSVSSINKPRICSHALYLPMCYVLKKKFIVRHWYNSSHTVLCLLCQCQTLSAMFKIHCSIVIKGEVSKKGDITLSFIKGVPIWPSHFTLNAIPN